ncbi:MAG: enoyl-CoA hydratase/isomerase family protein, partial [Thermosulfidibacteraceae bacterium]
MSTSDLALEKRGDLAVVSPLSLDIDSLVNLIGSLDCSETPVLLFDLKDGTSLNFSGCFSRLFDVLSSCNFIVVSFIDGTVRDGVIELAIASDLLFATDSSQILLTKIEKLDPSLLYYGLRFFGWVRFKELLFLGILGVDKLRDCFNGVFENRKTFEVEFEKVKREILELNPRGVLATKKVISWSYGMGFESALLLEKDVFTYIFGREETKDSLNSFLLREKQKFERRFCN